MVGDEPITGAYVCADESDRFVVLVFWGKRDDDKNWKLPTWRECWIFAVEKETAVVKRIHDEIYKPVIR